MLHNPKLYASEKFKKDESHTRKNYQMDEGNYKRVKGVWNSRKATPVYFASV